MEPTLYILMRTDLESMNPGKAIAQGSHATNLFEAWIDDEERQLPENEELTKAVRQWRGDRAFGRCLCVGVNERQLDIMMNKADMADWCAGTIVDPTYPINDGDVVHHISITTCGFVFMYDANNGYTEWMQNELKKFPLHP